MKKKILIVLAALPLAAFAQGMGMGQGMGPGMGQGMGPGMGPGMGGRGDPERMEKRMRLARTLGLAEALDLDSAQALKLGEQVAKFDERRLAAHKQLHEAHQTLRRAAGGEKVAAAEVDQAIQKALEARGQLQALDRELVATVTKDLTPEKKARAVLFLERFQNRFGPGHMMKGRRGMGPGMGRGRMGPGMMGPGGMGPGGMGPTGMGPGMMGGPGDDPELMAGSCMGPDCPDDDE